jgi:hypothetical protein
VFCGSIYGLCIPEIGKCGLMPFVCAHLWAVTLRWFTRFFFNFISLTFSMPSFYSPDIVRGYFTPDCTSHMWLEIFTEDFKIVCWLRTISSWRENWFGHSFRVLLPSALLLVCCWTALYDKCSCSSSSVFVYEGVSKSFRTESWRNIRLPLILLVEKQHKGLWQQNSLNWLTK